MTHYSKQDEAFKIQQASLCPLILPLGLGIYNRNADPDYCRKPNYGKLYTAIYAELERVFLNAMLKYTDLR